MTEDHRIYLLVALILVAIIIIARYPAIFVAFIGKASARCRDGSLSFSAQRCGTCSHHGGVEKFLRT